MLRCFHDDYAYDCEVRLTRFGCWQRPFQFLCFLFFLISQRNGFHGEERGFLVGVRMAGNVRWGSRGVGSFTA